MRKCPFCAEEIAEEAVKCKHCNEYVAPVNQEVTPAYTSAPKKTSGMAIASLVCSIVGFFICLFVGQILGIIFGYQAKKEIEQSQGTVEGEGLAKAGIIIGWIGIAIDILIIVGWAAFVGSFAPVMHQL